MTKPTIAELQHEFDKRLKVYTGNNEVSDLWLPYVKFSLSKTNFTNCLYLIDSWLLYKMCYQKMIMAKIH